MERQKKVVDASIAVKWFFEEVDTDKALKLIEKHLCGEIIITVPDLFLYEITNAMRYKKSGTKNILTLLNELKKFQFFIYPVSTEILEKTVELALKYELTIYDATYLALSELLDAQLITADKQILALHHPLVRSLEEKESQ